MVADLVRLLNGGYPIEAYCVSCDEFWPISVRERVALGALVTAACTGTPEPRADALDVIRSMRG